MNAQQIIDYFSQFSGNLAGLFNFCSNKANTWYLLFATKIIEPDCQCPNCENKTNVFHNTFDNYFNKVRYCPICNIHFSIFHRTILTRSHVDPPTFLALAYCWVNKCSLETTCSECLVNKNTVTNYFTSFRDSVVSELTEGPQPTIGGQNLDVEIDETVISHRKYNKGRLLATVWVFGGICRQTKQAFALVVPDRKASTLLQEIAGHIAPGTIIHSDTWASYQTIESIPNKNFIHHMVNHSKNFLNTKNGSHTQNIERMWRDLKFKKTSSCGIRSLEASGYVFEYIWRRNNIKALPRNQKLIRFLETIANTEKKKKKYLLKI